MSALLSLMARTAAHASIPFPRVVFPTPLVHEAKVILDHALRVGTVLQRRADGSCALRDLGATVPRRVQDALDACGSLLADGVDAIDAPTPMLGTVAAWWGVSHYLADPAMQRALTAATASRFGREPRCARHLLALGDVALR